MPDFWMLVLSAIGIFLMPYRGYNRGNRASALKLLKKSDWRRPILERFWLLVPATSLVMFVSLWCGLYAWRVGALALAILCCIAGAAACITAAVITAMPMYIIMDAAKKRRDKRAEAKPKP